MRKIIIVTVFAVLFSIFTLWLIDSWIKYPLFLFEIFTILLLYLIIDNYEVKVKVSFSCNVRLNWGVIIDSLLISFSTILFLLIFMKINGGIMQVVLALLCTSLLPGYALLNVSELGKYFSRVESVVLAYLLSYIFTGLVTLLFLPASNDYRAMLLLLCYIGLGVYSMLKHKRHPQLSTRESFARKIDLLAIMLTIGFYILSFYFIYPGFALLPGTDISRHYANSIVLGRTPNLYIGSTYLFAHLHESVFITLSNSSLISVQIALAALNLMLPLAFYVMAKSYLEKVDTRLPALATLFWVLFTNGFGGFAWLYFTLSKLSSIGQSQLQLLSSTADKTYNGVMYGVFGLWYVPATISFILLMVAIFLMGKKEIERTRYITLFSFLVSGLYLTHVAEALVFILFLAVFGLISKNENFRIEDALKSSIFGMVIVIAVYYVLAQVTPRFIVNTSLLISTIVPIIVSMFTLIFRHYIRPRLSIFKSSFKIDKKFLGKVLLLLLFFGYCVALLSWTIVLDSFHTWQVDTIGLVPWFMYPVILGINGLLAISALYFLTEDSKLYNAFALFIAFMVFAFVAGKIVTTVNLYFFDAGYWEKRFIWFIKIPLAILAPIPIIYVIDKLRKRGINVNAKTLVSVTVIGIIVLYGISTTFLNLEYWNIVANNPAYQPSSGEMEALNALKEIFDNDPKSWLATITGTSADMATFAAPADQLALKQLLLTAYTPEMVLTQLYRFPVYDHAYIYLHNRDFMQLNKFNDRLLANYIKLLPIVYENSEVKIYNVSKVSPPMPNSNTVLIMPLDKSLCDEQSLYTAYSLLSQGLYNYTVAYDLDDKALNSKTLVLSYDPPKENILTSFYEDHFNGTLASYAIAKGSWQIVSGELLGGEIGKYSEGIILSPIFAENFTASFKAKPVSGNASVANYVSLVYSWVDSKNYRIADILFGTDSYVYVHFRTIVNGVERAIPNWPGIKTDLKWNFGDEYNITVIVNGTRNQIVVNGKTYLSTELENIPGRIGLRYYRFYQVSFDELSLMYSISLNLRPIEDYLTFLESGGKLIILNVNGYHFFASKLFSVENSTLNAEKIEMEKKTLNLPAKITTPKLTLKSSKTSVLSRYIGLNDETPFIVKQSFGKGELFYVNIKPIIEALRKDEASAYYSLLGSLLEDLNLPKIKPNFVLSGDGYVKEVLLKNGVNVETTSIIFPEKTVHKQIEIRTSNETIVFLNVTSIKIENYSKLLVKTENLTISNGQGFYATLKLNSELIIKPYEGTFTVKIATKEAKRSITYVEQISIVPYGTIQLLARAPKVIANEATFIEFYTLGSLNWRTRTYGQNLNVNGKVCFQIILSDSYTLVKNVELSGSFEREPPIVMFNELSTILIAIFWALLFLPIFMVLIFFFRAKEMTYKKE
ncbi:MAG: hypothetical protein LM590_09345 [Thermofilum sp.]|nr:hypothetical protein [Thermofilum sp.]